MHRQRSERSDFAQRLRTLREATGLSQRDMAAKLGLSQPSYLAWETYNVALKPEQIERLTEVLKVDVSALFGSSESKATGRKGPPSKALQVFESIAKLPRAQQQRILGVVEALLAQHSAA